MEIRIYRSMQHYSGNKPLFCSKIDCPDAFSFENALSVFRSIYGKGIIIVIIAL